MYRQTLYEIAIERIGGSEKFLLCYASNKSRRFLVDCMRKRREAIDALCGGGDWRTADTAREGVLIGPHDFIAPDGATWRVRFTNRTKLEAEAKPLPFLNDVLKDRTANAGV